MEESKPKKKKKNSLDPLVVYSLWGNRAKALNVQLCCEIGQRDACAAVL